jgi:hypothetical protein
MEKKTFFFYLNQNIKNLIERNEGLGKEREKERERESEKDHHSFS